QCLDRDSCHAWMFRRCEASPGHADDAPPYPGSIRGKEAPIDRAISTLRLLGPRQPDEGGTMATIFTVSSASDLNNAIAAADAATSGTFEIDLASSITETADLNAINLHTGVTLTIDGSDGSGGGYTLDGAGQFRGLFVYSGTVSIENLTI